MAERRMFAKTIVLSDAFLDMPTSARCLYFTLAMLADDDGFVNSPKSVMRQTGSSLDDINILIAKKFILSFDSGVIVIKHWRIHNYIQKDRYKETKYVDEKSTLSVDEKGSYTFCIQEVSNMDTECIQNVSKMDTQVRLVKDRLVKDSLVKGSVVEDSKYIQAPDSPSPPAKPKKHKFGEFEKVLLSDEEYEKLCSDFGKDETEKAIAFFDAYIAEKGYKSKSHYLAMRRWVFDAVKDRKPKNQQKSSNPFLDLLEEGDYE